MTLEDRASCIADLAMPGSVRGELRRKRVYEKALQMLREVTNLAANQSALLIDTVVVPCPHGFIQWEGCSICTPNRIAS